ncbi:PorT family protein [Spirosoma koreense]
MKRTLCLLATLIVFIPHVGWGQARTPSVSLTLSPTAAHTNYKPRYLYPESDGLVVEPIWLDGRRWSTGASAGVSVLYAYAPGWSVSSGILFHQLSTRQSRLPAAGDGTVFLRNRVLRIPFFINYASTTRRISPYFSFGLLTDVPVTSRVVVTRVGESTQRLRLKPASSRPYFHVAVGAGVAYRPTGRYTLLAQPLFTYSFGQLGGASMYSPSFELGLQMQVAYSFALKLRK